MKQMITKMAITRIPSSMTLTNAAAIPLLKRLFLSKKESKNKHNAISDALDIYHRIEEARNHSTINTLLRLYLHHDDCRHVSLLWDDIQTVHREIEFDVLMQLCTKINDKSRSPRMTMSIQLLEWMKHRQYFNASLTHQHRKNYSMFVSKVLSHCNSIDQLQDIESLLPSDHRDVFIRTALMSKYAQFGEATNAETIFYDIPDAEKDIICINAMMHIFLSTKSYDETLGIYDQFSDHKDSRRNALFHCMAIKACISLNDYHRGVEIHSNLNKVLCCDHIVATALIDFYGHFGDSSTALDIFRNISRKKKDHIMIASMMKCLINNQQSIKAMEVYDEWHRGIGDHTTADGADGGGNTNTVHTVDDVLHSLAIKACILNNDYDRALPLVMELMGSNGRYQFDWKHPDLVISTVIEWYGHFGAIQSAVDLFDIVPCDWYSNVILGAMLKALVHHNWNEMAYSIYRQHEHLADDISHLLALKAIAKLKNERYAFSGQILIDSHFGDTDNLSIEVLTTMIDYYGETEQIEKAMEIFESVPESKRNIQCYNAMMNSYCINQRDKECMELYKVIKGSRSDLTSNTFQIALKAATQSTLLHHGNAIYDHLQDHYVHLLSDVAIQVCLIGMFGKCGQIDACKRIFDEIRRTDYKRYSKEIRLWHAIIHSYGRNGDIQDAMKSYYIMTDGVGLKADSKVFLLLLNSCCNSGDISIARNLWRNEIGDEMRVNVVAVYVDCLSRTGFVDEGYELAKHYDDATRIHKIKDNQAMWMSVLRSYARSGNHSMTECVYYHILGEYQNQPQYKDFLAAAAQQYAKAAKMARTARDSQQSDQSIFYTQHMFASNNITSQMQTSGLQDRGSYQIQIAR